ncbi:MAG: ribosomal protein [Pseudomonadota bacterium]|jgi:large subunit ribosomal protein L30
MTNEKTITIELVKSVIGTKQSHRATLIGLGLRAKINARSTLKDTPAVRGMIHKVRYLVKVIGE